MSDHGDMSAAEQEQAISAEVFATVFCPYGVEVTNAGAAGSGFSAFDLRNPALDMIAKEREHDEPGLLKAEEREEIRVALFSAILREQSKGYNPNDQFGLLNIGITVALQMWDLGIPPFGEMTLQEIGDQAQLTRAAICEKHKQRIQKLKEQAGQKGTHNKRQKKAEIVEVYKRSAQGNRNRRTRSAKDKLAAEFGG